MCDKDGIVYGSKSGIARIAMIEPDDIDDAWDTLLDKDPESSDTERAPENEGRRIEKVPGGYKLLNFAYYRGLRNDDDRREQNRQAQARFKAKSHGKPKSATVSQDKPPKAHTEAEAEAETRGEHSPSRDEFLAETRKAGIPDDFAMDKWNGKEERGWGRRWKPFVARVMAWYREACLEGKYKAAKTPVEPRYETDEMKEMARLKAEGLI